MFNSCRTTTDQGNIGEAIAILYYTQAGYIVNKPLTQNQSYDLVVDWLGAGKLERVSVKTTKYQKESGIYRVIISTQGGNQSYNTRKLFDRQKVDRLFIVTSSGQVYDIPTNELDCTTNLTLGIKYRKFMVSLGIGEPNSL